MRRLAAIAAVTLALSGVAAPALAAEPVPEDQSYSLTGAPVEPSPSHHKIKPPASGKGDLYQLLHGGFKDTARAKATDTTQNVPVHSSTVLLKAGVTIAKVAKTKALKQPKQPKQAKQQSAKIKQPSKSKTTKATTAKPLILTVSQATQYAFAKPPKPTKLKMR